MSVKDEGIGLTPEQVKTIFEPFSKPSSHGRGNGVGLSICKQICEHLGGKIMVISRKGEGSTFHF